MQQALIVDDSKTSAVVLGKMLRKHHMDVIKVESAEEALELLADARPNIIFMDHMMPGMDGFEAVKAIKSTPALSAIPIVMHTSKTGDIYVGHARALGAEDILNKPATEQDLSAVLERLERNGHRLSTDNKGLVIDRAPPVDRFVPQPANHYVAPQPDATDISSRATLEMQPVAMPASSSRRQIWYGLLIAIALIWVLALYLPTEQHRRALMMQQANYFSFLSWSLSQSGQYDFAEKPLSGKRLDLLDGTLRQLFSMNFSGVVRMEIHSGAFCIGSVDRELSLAALGLSVSDCAMLGLPAEQLNDLELLQSPEFSRYLETTELLGGSDIRIEIVPMGDGLPLFAYPQESAANRAGEWNAVALKNNRVVFSLKPDS